MHCDQFIISLHHLPKSCSICLVSYYFLSFTIVYKLHEGRNIYLFIVLSIIVVLDTKQASNKDELIDWID
jgi:hypothetical protein